MSLALAAAVALHGRDAVSGLTGDYADEGVVVADPSDRFPGDVSLHALLVMEFDPALARQLHAMTGRIRVKQAANGLLKIQVLDADGAELKRGRWWRDTGYVQQDGCVYLRFASNGDEYFFRLELVGEQRLLQVTVHRESISMFGPAAYPVGTFLFPRID